MPKAIYDKIYKDVKTKIETGDYEFQEYLPSEHTLTAVYDCSRNTVRRAISDLVRDGYVQTMQGKGVQVIFQPVEPNSFILGSIESFKESSLRNHKTGMTKVVCFTTLEADEKISHRTGLKGTLLYYIQRVHYMDGKPLILNHNYFRQDLIPDSHLKLPPSLSTNTLKTSFIRPSSHPNGL